MGVVGPNKEMEGSNCLTDSEVIRGSADVESVGEAKMFSGKCSKANGEATDVEAFVDLSADVRAVNGMLGKGSETKGKVVGSGFCNSSPVLERSRKDFY